MEETVEEIVSDVMSKIGSFGFVDQAWLLQEVADRLEEEANTAIRMEYFGEQGKEAKDGE